MDRILINVGDREFATGLTYTAVSRVRSLDCLAFDPLPNYQRIISIFGTTSFRQMREEVCRREVQAAERKARQVAEREARQIAEREALQVSWWCWK